MGGEGVVEAATLSWCWWRLVVGAAIVGWWCWYSWSYGRGNDSVQVVMVVVVVEVYRWGVNAIVTT